MGGPSNWVGVKQGRLYVIRRLGSRQDGQATWECLCECGSRCVKGTGSLRSGVQSCSHACGIAASNRRRVKHGYAKTKEHSAWQAAKQRCSNPKHPQYKNYGARGVIMHPAWVESFADFLAHVGPAPGDGRHVSIDRIDNNRGYEPGNVRWVSSVKLQINNRRRTRTAGGKSLSDIIEASGLYYSTVDGRWRNGLRGEALTAPKKTPKLYTINGVSKTLPEWAKTASVNEGTVRGRMRNGESLEQALSGEHRPTKPYSHKPRPETKTKVVKRPRRYFTIGGETLTLNQWSERCNMSYSTLRYRLRTGFTIEEALNLVPKSNKT